MKDVAKQKTIALVSHAGAGSTSLAEGMLYLGKVTNRLGSVAEGTSNLDYEPEEIKRKSTISATFHSLPWKKHQITFADSPGDDNFLNDSRAILQGVDSVLVVIDSVDGVKVSTEKVWSFADEEKLPRLIIINKMDKERADFYRVAKEVADIFETPKALPLMLPIGAEDAFKGLVDLISGKAFVFESDGQFSEIQVPEEMLDLVDTCHEQLVEAIVETDEKLLEKYLEGEEINPEALNKALGNAVKSLEITPIIPAAGLKLIGISQILDSIISYLASPDNRDSWEGLKPNSAEKLIRKADPNDAFSALVIKTLVDPFAGQLSIFRIVSGTLKADSGFYNANAEERERFGQILKLEGKSQNAVEEAGPGDIVAVSKLKVTKTGDTICDEEAKIIYESHRPFPTIVAFAVGAKEKGDEEKVFAAINRMLTEDITLRLTRNEQTKEMILSGMGQVHIDVTLEKIKRKYGVEIELKAPKVAYKETIKGKTKVQGRYKKQTGGKGQYGDAVIEMEPLPRGEGFIFEDKIVGGAIPRQFIPAVERGIVEAMLGGVVSGNPVVDVKASLVFGSYHDVDSSEMAFIIAGSMAFKKGFLECNPTILEPIMLLTVTVPDEFMGDIMGDISGRRGKLLGTESKGSSQIIKANVPQAELLSYAPVLTSMTGGRGGFVMEFTSYEEAPGNVRDQIIESYKSGQENE